MLHVLIAMDSLKGSLTSMEAGNAARAGVLRAAPEADVQVRPLADGGEGTVEALTRGLGGTVEKVSVTGPLGEKVNVVYGILPDGRTAVMEIASAAGLPLVPEQDRDPRNTTTFGAGEMIRDAAEKNCRRFIVGLGGSATNDGGIGMLQALGFGMLDRNGKQVPFGARGLKDLVRITDQNVLPELADCHFRIACDVTSPLCGPRGASRVFGPQKGADADLAEEMDRWMAGYADLVSRKYPGSDPDAAGSGAAGGLGFAFHTFLKGELKSGAQIVLEETRLEDHIKNADLVITGEGRLDGQTAMGKAPAGVAGLAKKYGKPVIAFAGSVAPDAGKCNETGVDAFFPILRTIQTLQEAMDPEQARRNMTAAVEQAVRLFLI